jgi:hypothetical protein
MEHQMAQQKEMMERQMEQQREESREQIAAIERQMQPCFDDERLTRRSTGEMALHVTNTRQWSERVRVSDIAAH